MDQYTLDTVGIEKISMPNSFVKFNEQLEDNLKKTINFLKERI